MFLKLILKLLATIFGGKPTQAPPPAKLDTAARIIRALDRRGAVVHRKPGEVNIVYVEGADFDDDEHGNASYKANGNKPNLWNDVRVCVLFEDGKPVIHSWWQATTEPGHRYTQNPIAAGGAARIKLGQQKVWQVGLHRGYEALAQTGAAVVVTRDANKDYKRDGDKTTMGFYGINQHHGHDAPEHDVGPHSAGCLVGKDKDGHWEFMALVKSDPRYKANSRYVFDTTVIEAAELD